MCDGPLGSDRRSQVVALTIGAVECSSAGLVLPRPGSISGIVAVSENVDPSVRTGATVTADLVEPPLCRPVKSVAVGVDGQYRLEPLSPGHDALEMVGEDVAYARVVELDLGLADERADVTLDAHRAGYIAWRLQDFG